MPRPIPNTYFQVMAQQVIHQADQALYRAKLNRRSGLVSAAVSGWEPPASPEAAQAWPDPA